MRAQVIARRRGVLFAAALALVVSSCANTRAYDEQVRLTETLQLENDQLEAYLLELQAELDGLRAAPQEPVVEEVEPDLTDVTVGEANAPAGDDPADELARVQARIDALDTGEAMVEPLVVPGGFGFSLAEQVVFDSGSSAVKSEGATVLAALAEQIGAEPFTAVWVRGHSDSMPVRRAETLERFPHGNLQLSAARAVEVAALLVGEGLPTERVMVAGFGPTRPVADNATPEGRSANRRVEIFVLLEADEADLRGGF